jgi:dolichyl-phosphate beta-glucosyltransferase
MTSHNIDQQCGAARILAEARSDLQRLRTEVDLKPAQSGDVELSIAIPAYNEQARLPHTVLKTIQWCATRKLNFELILIDDGSKDQTLPLARLFEEGDSRIRSIACPHSGKGAAVRMGMLNAKGRYVLFMDADGATPLNEIPKLIAAIDAGYDVAIGSRIAGRAGGVEVKTSLHRRLIGRTFAMLVGLLAVKGIGDTQCGFKMFRREVASAIFSNQKIPGFAFDVEVLFIARQMGFSIAEIPVNWIAQPGSKVAIVRDSLRMLWDISHVRWLHRRMNADRQLVQQPEDA